MRAKTTRWTAPASPLGLGSSVECGKRRICEREGGERKLRKQNKRSKEITKVRREKERDRHVQTKIQMNIENKGTLTDLVLEEKGEGRRRLADRGRREEKRAMLRP